MKFKKEYTTVQDMLLMELHEEFEDGCVRIKRVPNGWIYTRMHEAAGVAIEFVPEQRN